MKINLQNAQNTSFRLNQASYEKQEECVTFTRIPFTFSIALVDAIDLFDIVHLI